MRLHHFVILLLSASFAAGQTRQPSTGQTVIDFTALGKDGRPILDLAPSELTLQVDGRQRDIEFFQLLGAGTGEAPRSAPVVPPPFATNAVSGTMGRDVLVIIDEESIAAGKQRVAQDAVREFITRLGPTARPVLLSPRQGGPTVHIGDLRADLREALSRFSAVVPSNMKDDACRTITALQMLQSLFGGYSGQERPRTHALRTPDSLSRGFRPAT